jgi:hypothetical protein
MKLIRIIFALMTAFLGAVHIGFTPVFYPGCRLDSMWFAGTGLALVFVGLANGLLIGRSELWTKICGGIANFAALTLMTMVAIMLRQPHAWLACLLILGLFVMGVIDAGCCPKCSCGCKEDKPA